MTPPTQGLLHTQGACAGAGKSCNIGMISRCRGSCLSPEGYPYTLSTDAVIPAWYGFCKI
ncbi:hypothetical protein MBAV_001742 [Candidatus Magnetobacterium bavaricum]|uniref:Uncharacterized protein n=1 Tax=Candidatus Magnetobacterium bavaricum TaxID=29290 RepID=A0A0F3GVZ7_9BACT|nr:hypothetical protein MBAV_001742 [Candidatus Magnetobacterium bavaricum]